MSLEGHDAIAMPVEKVASNTDEMELQQSPLKKRKIGITAVQKQALMENLQLEIAERARKLRSNYNIHAQSLRTRIEIRVNRIPMSLRKMKMADLLAKYSSIQGEPAATAISARGPPVPEKDNRSPERSIIQKVYPMAPPPPSARPAKRRSDEMSGGDKENEVTSIDNTKKRPRANPAVAPSNQIRNAPTHVLSPTSSNTRTVPRNNNNGQPNSNPAMTLGSIRAGVSRPVSPTKGTTAASNLLHSVVRSTAPRPTILPSPRKPAFPSSAATAAASPRKRGATVGAGPSSRPGTRTADARRVSGTSESSEGSTSTVVKHKRPATAPGDRPPPPKASATSTTTSKKAGAAVMNSLKKAGITASGPATATAAATKKAAAAGAGAAGAGGKSGTEKRVLRKRA